MGSENAKMEGATLSFEFEGSGRAFSADAPIIGVLKLKSQKAIPAYGIEMFLE